ncbi:MAG: hypothetical protein JJU12_02880 [Chlamydiales bacterium]|nr:hypothetical protein [Chlamydiales bacterium]
MGKPFSQEQREAWVGRIQSQQASGLSIQRWCEENSIASHLFHYWRRRLFPNTIDRSSFTELTDQKGCTIDIECQGARMRIESPTLKRAFQVLRELKC